MQELSKIDLRDADPLNNRQVSAIERLHKLSDEFDPICRQAPIIWDGENTGDSSLAKQNCLGLNENGRRVSPACPIIEECLETALILETKYGVWGGKTAIERKRML